MSDGAIHHIHKRKRIHQKLEEYPHKNKWVARFDKFLLVVAILNPMVTFPQISKIFRTKSAQGISTLTFALLAIFNIPWLIYGILHKAKPIIIAFSLT